METSAPPQLPPPIAPHASAATVEAVARHYRNLVLLIGGQFVLYGLQLVLGRALGSLQILFFPAWLALLAALAVTAYQLTVQLGEALPILWAIAMFFPCLNILTLLVLSSKAQTWCRHFGIQVGLLGPSAQSIEEFRRRSGNSQ